MADKNLSDLKKIAYSSDLSIVVTTAKGITNLMSVTRLPTSRGEKGEPGADGKSAYQVAVSLGFSGTEEEWIESLGSSNEEVLVAIQELSKKNDNVLEFLETIKTSIDLLKEEISDISYEPVAIGSFSITPPSAEMGATVNNITFKWSINKNPASLKLDNESIAVNLREKIISNAGITTNKTFNITATDSKGYTSEKSITFKFMNGQYYGTSSLSEANDITNSTILNLSKVLSSEKISSITVNASEDHYIYYALPQKLGTPIFSVGIFEGGFSFIKSMPLTNAMGYRETYDIYRSVHKGLGQLTVKIS